MGVEVKGAGDGVVIADRGCNDGALSTELLLRN
jgi:hypothetical protein